MTTDGLTTQEAHHRLTQYGPNEFQKEKHSALQILARQFKSSLIYLLILAAVLSFFLQDFSDGVMISVILLVNALLGFFQEFRSEKAIEHLSQFISKKILVKRDGKQVLIDEKLLVPGDVVIVREGDVVPADLEIVQLDNILVNESQLTGESVPLSKRVSEKLFAGSIIEKGDAVGVVFATAGKTELGKIATLSLQTKKITQYEKSLQYFSSYLVRITLVTLVIIFVAKLLITNDVTHISSLFLFVIAIAIAVIPEALPVIATVTLARGALELAKKHVIVKRLSSLEDLGNITLLCTDKTGTLTENKMAVQSVVSQDSELFQKFAYATIEVLDEKRKQLHVSSYDAALAGYISRDIQHLASHLKQVKSLPFDPDARRRRVVLEDKKDKRHYLVSIGSTEALLEISSTHNKHDYLTQIAEDGKQGIRHLAIAYKEIEYDSNMDILQNEHNLHFLGFVKLSDPLRPTTQRTIQLAKKLGIAIKILTGDSKEVAEFVGREVGLLGRDDHAFTGSELDALTAEQFQHVISTCNVFAKVTPEQKYRLINLLKEHYVVGYQGDGINDAPSLKLADVAIAVSTATDVAKESADILLLNKDLSVIINGIQYGRTIFVNINKYIKHTMVGNWGNFFALAALYLISNNLPLLPIQILLTSLLTDVPLIAIYSDTIDAEEVAQPQKYDPRPLMFISLFLGTLTTLIEFIFFGFVHMKGGVRTETMVFLFLTLVQLIIIFSVRTKKPFFNAVRPSSLLTIAVIVVFALSLLLLYIPPIAQLLSFVPLSASTIGFVFGMTIVYFLLLDGAKVFYYSMIDNWRRS